MRVLVIGAHGKVGQLIVEKCIAAGYKVRAMVRDASQVCILESLGAEGFVLDIEADVEPAFAGMDAVVFTAGSGAHTGPDKTITVDLLGAMKTVDAAVKAGVNRYIMVSTQGARIPEEKPEAKRYYFVAKAEADKYLRKSILNYTIFRPGKLTNEPAGKAQLAGVIKEGGTTSREMLAEAIVFSLPLENMFRQTLDFLDGEEEMTKALNVFQ